MCYFAGQMAQNIELVKSKYGTVNCFIAEEESELLIYAATSLNKL